MFKLMEIVSSLKRVSRFLKPSLHKERACGSVLFNLLTSMPFQPLSICFCALNYKSFAFTKALILSISLTIAISALSKTSLSFPHLSYHKIFHCIFHFFKFFFIQYHIILTVTPNILSSNQLSPLDCWEHLILVFYVFFRRVYRWFQ